MFYNIFLATTSALLLIIVATPAYAYIGPAIAVLSSLFGPLIALIVVILLTLMYPVMKLYRKIKASSDKEKEEQEK